jgi:hypothetical protein
MFGKVYNYTEPSSQKEAGYAEFQSNLIYKINTINETNLFFCVSLPMQVGRMNVRTVGHHVTSGKFLIIRGIYFLIGNDFL